MIQLSILIPTIPDRHEMFTSLFNKLSEQITYCETVHPTLGSVELLVDDSKKFLDGGLSIGKKREALVKRAEGNYSCFVDDDEDISPRYVEAILRLAQQEQDIITFKNFTVMENFWMVVDMSIYFTNEQANPKFTVRRKPWHCCPVRTRIARLYDFDDISYGEDAAWMDKVLKHVSTEAKTDEILHLYRHGKHSEADKIVNYGKAEV